jgi:glycosyltransferase involved in cell wall biosynthesis
VNSKSEDAAVDVIVPVRNRPRLIRTCLESVRAQTLQPNTVIVVDDGSTDDTPEVLAEYAQHWTKLRVISSKHRGPAHARNLGLAASQAPLVAFLDSDDVWQPAKLERQIALLGERPEVGVVHCACYRIDETGRRLDPTIFAPSKRGQIFETMINTLYNLSGSTSAVVARRDLVMQVGGFDESLLGVEDQDLWLRLARISLVDYVSEPLVGLRVHRANRSAARRRNPALALLQQMAVWAKWSHLTDEAVLLRAFRRKAVLLNRASPFHLIHHIRVYRQLKTSDLPLATRLFPSFGSYLRSTIPDDAIALKLYRRLKLMGDRLLMRIAQIAGKLRS